MKYLLFFFAFAIQAVICFGQDPAVEVRELKRLIILASSPEVSSELGVSKFQGKSLHALANQFAPSIDAQIRAFAKKHGRFPEKGDVIGIEVAFDEREALAILTDKQWARLRQLDLQMRVNQLGIRKALLEGPLLAKIQLNPQQADQIAARLRRLELEAEESIARVLESLQQNAIDEFPEEQRAVISELLGPPFIFQSFRGMDLNKPIKDEDSKNSLPR